MKGMIITLFAVAALASADNSLRPNGCPVDFSVHAQLPHEQCNRFYLCTFGMLIAKTCPDGLLYNTELQLCDWPHQVQCEDRLITEGNVGDHGTAVATCSEINSDLVLIEHKYCNMFYKCMNRVPLELQCSTGLLYNAELQMCDWPFNVKCGERI